MTPAVLLIIGAAAAFLGMPAVIWWIDSKPRQRLVHVYILLIYWCVTVALIVGAALTPLRVSHHG